MPRTRLGAIVALLSVALLASACASAGPDAGATGAPGTLVITAPADGTTVDTPTITVTGTAPDGAEVVHDIPFAPDDRVTAAGGRWSMTVELDEGANELTFRLGDDEDTARTITVTYRPAAAATSDPTGAPTTEPAEPATPEPTAEATEEPTEPPLAEAFKPFTLKGRGNKVAKFRIPEDAAAIATITNKGTSNFVVWTVAADGSTNDLLVNEIGSYKGTHLVDAIRRELRRALGRLQDRVERELDDRGQAGHPGPRLGRDGAPRRQGRRRHPPDRGDERPDRRDDHPQGLVELRRHQLRDRRPRPPRQRDRPLQWRKPRGRGHDPLHDRGRRRLDDEARVGGPRSSCAPAS